MTLDDLIDAALIAFPDLAYKTPRDGFASRAHAAAHLVITEAVTHLGTLPNGNDCWRVGDYTCSVRGGTCQCADYSAPTHNNGRLCKHRLAVMFRVKLSRSMTDRLAHILAAAPTDTITLRIEVIYTRAGRIYKLAGHHYPGLPWSRYPSDEAHEITADLFERVLRRAGWSLDGPPARQPGRYYHYFLVRGLDGTGHLHDLAVQDQERIAQTARLREVEQTLDLLHEMETP